MLSRLILRRGQIGIPTLYIPLYIIRIPTLYASLSGLLQLQELKELAGVVQVIEESGRPRAPCSVYTDATLKVLK